MGFCLQLKLLLWKNFTLKKRKPIVLIFELFIPLVLFFILLGIRKKQPAYPVNASDFPAFPLPSAGVIAIMQAFCDNGVKNEDGFLEFPNSSVTPFLQKLNNVSHNINFFQPDFTPNDLDEIPIIYKSIVEDPVAIHDCFTNASHLPIGALFQHRLEFETFLDKNLSLSKESVEAVLNSSLDLEKLYAVIFLLDFPPPESNFLTILSAKTSSSQKARTPISLNSLEHLDDLFVKMKKYQASILHLYEVVTWIFDTKNEAPPPKINLAKTGKEMKELLFSPESIELMCQEDLFSYVLNPASPHNATDLDNFQKEVCSLDPPALQLFSQELKSHFDGHKLVQELNLQDWNVTIARSRFRKLVNDLNRFTEFELMLNELSYLAQALPQDACHSLNHTDERGANETTHKKGDVDETPHPQKKAKQSQYGLLRIWLGMQKTICGKEHNAKQPIPSDEGDINLVLHIKLGW